MARSQNGWPVDESGAGQDRAPLLRDVTVPNGVLRGDVAEVFRWLARRYDAEVERLVAGWCWGWFVKRIQGSDDYSNHSAGTAVDFNAPRHPMGEPASGSLSGAQILACRRIVAASGGVLRWGGDYTGRPDVMHWEIIGDARQVAALAKRIREDGMDWDDKIGEPIGYDSRTFRQGIRDLSNERDWGHSPIGTKGLVSVPAPNSPYRQLEQIPALLARLEALEASVKELTERDPVDVDALGVSVAVALIERLGGESA